MDFDSDPLIVVILQVTVVSLAGAIATGIGVGVNPFCSVNAKIMISAQTFQLDDLSRLDTLKWQLSLWLAGSALTDTLIAVIMTVLLLRSRTREIEQTDNILVRIVRLTVETNTITAVFNNRVYMSSKGMFPRSRTLSTTASGIEVKVGKKSPSGQTARTRSESEVGLHQIKVFRETTITKEGPLETLEVGFPS
ncbi:hypothetical protein C0993_003549 [Termitomyces sp. T159_Od127]|nr:hypothetical protein C0993_003549 [Termitomyces sp. T159_Od127]